MKKHISLVLLLIALALLPALAQAGQQTGCNVSLLLQEIDVGEITEAEDATIASLLERKRLAVELGNQFAGMWGLSVFALVSTGDTGAISDLYKLVFRYGAFSGEMATAGEFSDSALQDLYDALLAQGATSLSGAVQAMLAVKELEIQQLSAAIGGTDKEDLLVVYQNLLKVTQNQLRALNGHILMFVSAYAPQYLDAATFEAIMTSAMVNGCFDAAGEPIAPEDMPKPKMPFCFGNIFGHGNNSN